MDHRELYGDLEETLRAFLDGFRKGLHIAKPVIVSKDGDGHVTTLQSAIKGVITDPLGNQTMVDMPDFQDAPVHYPGGGNVVTTHPIKKGEEGVALFLSPGMDVWHQKSGAQKPIDARLHSLLLSTEECAFSWNYNF